MRREHYWYAIALVAGAFFAASCQGQTREQSRAMFTFIAYSVMSESVPVPTPTPQPVTDTCENCNGRGKVGDGTIMVVCPECGGTGKKKKVASSVIDIKQVDGWPPKTELAIIESTPVRKVTLAHGYDLSDGPSDYRPRWTWPGDLRSHLRATHKIDTATWTQDQREMYHDQWHDRFGSR